VFINYVFFFFGQLVLWVLAGSDPLRFYLSVVAGLL